MKKTLISVLVLSAFLGGCGSSGGSKGDGSPPAVVTPPVVVAPPAVTSPPPLVTGPITPAPATISQTLQLNGGVSSGLSISATATSTNYGTASEAVTITGVSGPNGATVTVNPTGAINSITLNTPNAVVGGSTSSWSYPQDAGSVTATTVDVCGGASCATSQRDMNLATAGVFQYMTYGDWFHDAGSSGTVPSAGGFLVVGQETTPGNIPSSGTATYVGAAGGLYANAGTVNAMVADFKADADFAARKLAVSTSNMKLDGVVTPQLNYTGTLSYTAGSNQFSGPLVTPGAGTGTATGKFFGPAAQEIGGVTDLTVGSARAIGFFVGKK